MSGNGRSQAVMVSVPGRVCLAGESLDWMNGGSSVVAAVPLRTRVTAWQTADSPRLALSSGSPVFRARVIPAGQAAQRCYDGDVLDYMQAATWVTLRDVERIGGTVVTAYTDLPVSAGLSSSACITVGVAAALDGLKGGNGRSIAEICELARQAEVGELRSGAGWMDFLACGGGGVNRIDAGTEPRVYRLVPTLGVAVVVIDTRERRATREVLISKRERFRAGESDMVAYSREVPRLVDALTGALSAPSVDYEEVGYLINAAHVLLRDKVHCSTDLIETCVQRVLTAGAFGAKLSGSGHGGCLFALVPDMAVTAVLHSVQDLPVYAVALPTSESEGLISSAGGGGNHRRESPLIVRA